MDKKTSDEVLERLENSYREMVMANNLLWQNGEKLSIVDTLLVRIEEAIQRWSGRA